jgi:hypothetical protein
MLVTSCKIAVPIIADSIATGPVVFTQDLQEKFGLLDHSDFNRAGHYLIPGLKTRTASQCHRNSVLR